MGKLAFIYTPDFLEYKLAEGHPLNPLRLELTVELLKAVGLWTHPNIDLITPKKAERWQLELVHTKKYLDYLESVNDKGPEIAREANYDLGLGPGDNPMFPGIYESSRQVAGASITAMEMVQSGKYNVAFNFAGGLHHAMADRAAGFCIINDVAVAIKALHEKEPDARVMYIDIDAHHGDGVQEIFYDTDKVLTLSFHQFARNFFPGTGHVKEGGSGGGKGYSYNVPLPEGTYDEIFLNAFNQIVPKIMETYEPDYVFTQLGVDTHYHDPLAELGMSTSGQFQVLRKMKQYIEKYGNNKWVAFGGGGYYLNVVARSWTLFTGLMADVEVPSMVPAQWKEFAKEKTDEVVPDEMRDTNPGVEFSLVRNPFYAFQFEEKIDPKLKILEEVHLPQIKKKSG